MAKMKSPGLVMMVELQRLPKQTLLKGRVYHHLTYSKHPAGERRQREGAAGSYGQKRKEQKATDNTQTIQSDEPGAGSVCII